MSYDFTIGSLNFNKCISEKNPYERATAPFKKEQFDSAPTVGDQSLSGWWTRGQLSFHGGAGLTYYEVLEGETVLSRYTTSSQMDTLTTPGEAILDYGTDTWFTPATGGILDMSTDGGGAYYIRTTNNTDGIPFKLGSYSPGSPTQTQQFLVSGTTARWLCDNAVDTTYVCSSSTIERMVSGGAPQKIYDKPASTTIQALWYAKDRLWALTDDGGLYALAPTPGTIPTTMASPVCTLVTTVSTKPSLTATGSGILLSNGGRQVYRITLADDGTVPTLTAPVVAAEMPAGESVYHLFYHLGYVVIVTSRGVRVAQEQSDGGLIYGPMLFGNTTGAITRKSKAHGTSVYVAVNHPEESGLQATVYRIELSTQVGENPLEFAHARMWDHSFLLTGDGTNGVVGTSLDYSIASWGASNVVTSGRGTHYYASSGSVTTGYHRFGTLEPKHFHSVAVRCGSTSTGGSIDVSRVDANGTVTSLGNISSTEGSKEFSLGLTAPVERIALKFTLNRSPDGSGASPILLGYQLKGLPSPTRQRLIRVPLMMFDVERPASGRAGGREGKAWERLAELEDLEESDALVTFTDHDTGETGSAYIESIEMRRTSATGNTDRSNGFGGVVNVTLRVV